MKMIDVVGKAIEETKKHFPDAVFSLEIKNDQGIDDYRLNIFVSPKEYGEDFIEQLKKAERELIRLFSRRRRGESAMTLDECLEKFPRAALAIDEAIKAARKHFPDAVISLEMYSDPEIDDYHPVIYVRPKEYGDDFMERLEKAEKEFIHLLEGIEGWVHLTTDFNQPD